MKNYIITLTTIIIIVLLGCQKMEIREIKNEVNFSNSYDKIGLMHNTIIFKTYTKDLKNQKSFNFIEIYYNNLKIYMSENYQLDTNNLPSLIDILGIYQTFLQRQSIIIDTSLLSYYSKIETQKLENLLKNHYNNFIYCKTKINELELSICENNALTEKEKEILLISCAIAKNSLELWTNNGAEYLPRWEVVAADVVGFLIGNTGGIHLGVFCSVLMSVAANCELECQN